MTQSNTKTAEKFRQSAQAPIPEYVYVYHHTGDHVEVRFEDVTIKAPDGTDLIKDIDFTLKDGERAGLTGPNGGGKSTIFRHMGELTHGGRGRIHITLPEGKRMMNVSQEMRKSPTTLQGMMSYPNSPETYTHEQYEECLDDAGLPQLKVQLPWNAAKPDVLFERYKEALDNEIRKNARDISAKSAQQIEAALIKALDKKIDLPETIAEHFTPEYEDALKEKIISYVKEKFKELAPEPAIQQDKKIKDMMELLEENGIIEKISSPPAPEEKRKTVLFPGHTGRKIARNVLSNGQNHIQNWLFMGHKMPLSGGQAEQLGFARMFLQADEAALFLLDEVSSALKEQKADELYKKLFEKAKGATAIGIIHNNNLLKHYTHHLELGEDKHIALKKLGEEADSTPQQAPEI